MKSAPPYSPRPRSSAPRLAVGAGALGALWVSGCFGELPPLVEDGIGGTGGAAGGTLPVLGGAGGTGAPGGSGGNGGSGGSDSCAGKVCGGVCVQEPSAATGCAAQDCTPCADLPNSVMGCSADGECRVEACAPGFVDCNGDALGKSGAALAGSNGCERRFGNVAADASPPLRVPQETMNIDGQPEDWNGFEMYAVSQGCNECGDETDDKTERVISPRTAPRPDDFIGYFRITWDSSNLYLLAEAYDDHVFTGNGNDATRGDGVVLVFDGLNDRVNGYGNDDTRLYINVDGAHASFNRPLQAGQVIPSTNQSDGAFCYRIEAQISWRFIVGSEGQSANGQFPPSEGRSYGFDISFNDWDPALGAGEAVSEQHQNQSWWVDPGNAWWRETQGFGSMQLQGPGGVVTDAGAP